MRSTSDQLLLMLPAVLAVLLLALFMAPMQGFGVPLAPNVAWLMSWVMMRRVPQGWGYGLAFATGLAQDVLFGTPLGAQALVALLLCMVAQKTARRPSPPFRLRWLEATLALLVAHAALWLLLALATATPPLALLLYGTLGAVLWFPLFDSVAAMLTRLLPAARSFAAVGR